MKQEATDVQPKDRPQPSRDTQLHQPYILEPHMNQFFYPRITSTVGLTTRKRRTLSWRNVTLNRSDLPRPQYPNPIDQVMPQHQAQHSEPVKTPLTQF